MTACLREASPKDVDFIVAGFADIHDDLPVSAHEIFRARIVDDVFGKAPKARIYVYEAGGAAVGFFLVSSCYFASKGSVLWVSQAYIAPQYRGRYFRPMFSALKEKALADKFSRIVWATDVKKGRLSGFWRKMGAREFTDDFTFWSVGGEG